MIEGARNIISGQTNKTVESLKRTNRELKSILEKLSNGRRINRASDDASGLAVSEGFQSRIRGFKIATRNIEDALSALQTADTVGKSVTEQLQRQRELAITARQDTLSDRDREALNTEYQAITEEINRTISSARFNRQSVADGRELGSGNATVQTGPEQENNLNLPQIDLLTPVGALDTTSLLTSEDAQVSLTTIDSIIEHISNQASSVGAAFNSLLINRNTLEVAMVNTAAAQSIIEDQDMAEGIAKLVQQSLLDEGSTAAFNRFQEINRNQILGFLQG
ncbi:Flagellin protein FlaB [Chitinispirillum alkaliphilum]|nr:Flagellin protein FlaB [Chitinispirillum alkaliphilum]